MMTVYFPVMLSQLIERSVGYLVFAAIKHAFVLVLVVVFVRVPQEFIVAHLFFAIGDFGTRRCLAFEPSDSQVLLGLLYLLSIFICVFELLDAGQAFLSIILSRKALQGPQIGVKQFAQYLGSKST